MGFSRVMTRPMGQVRRFSKSCGSSQIDSGGAPILTGRVGAGSEGSNKSLDPTRPDPTRRDPREMTRPVNDPWFWPRQNLESRSARNRRIHA